MRASDRMTAAVAVAMMLAVFTFRSLTVDRTYVIVSWILIAAIAGITLGLRRARLPEPAVLAIQLVTVIVFVLALSATIPGSGEPFYEHYASLWVRGIEHMQTQAAPMVANDGVTVMFVTVIGLITLLTDLLVSGLGKPVWGIAPPLTLFLVPAVGLGVDTGAVSFICIAVGYLGILLAEGLNGTSRWTRGLSRDSADRSGGASPVVWRAAGLIGAPAVVLALVFGQLVPTLSLDGFGFGQGNGSGGQLQLTDPTLDLRRNLNQPPDQVVIRYTTDRPGGLYLRMASLPELNSSGWHNVAMKLTEGNQLPDIPGIGTEPSSVRQTSIEVTSDFSSQYLPLPYAPRSFVANGDWAYDTNSLVVISNQNGRSRSDAIRGLSYTVRSVDLEPSSDDLVGAVAGVPADSAITSAVPSDLPARFTELTNQIIKDADAETAAQKAAAIQAYLRSDEFTYSVQPLPGTGYGALDRFLFQDKTGYCEQFAGSMAMMARIAGIPSRVAVGFLPGVRNGNEWDVSINKMHAWPELYFAGRGWVRFEPTPAQQTGTAPDWTVLTDTRPSAEPSASASTRPSASSRPETQAPSTAPLPTPTSASDGGAWVRTGLITVGGVLVLLILAAPATLRIRRRTSRLSGVGDPAEQVESAWAEIRDSVVDYGGNWPSGSPRSIGESVGKRLDVAESAGMGQVAVLVERSRYAPSVDLDPDADLAAITTDIRRGLAAPRSPFRRLLAVLLPVSLFRRSRDRTTRARRADKAESGLQD